MRTYAYYYYYVSGATDTDDRDRPTVFKYFHSAVIARKKYNIIIRLTVVMRTSIIYRSA